MSKIDPSGPVEVRREAALFPARRDPARDAGWSAMQIAVEAIAKLREVLEW